MQSGKGSLRRWWEKKYQQPARRNPLFQRLTTAELQEEQLEDLWAEKFQLEDLLEDDDTPGRDSEKRRVAWQSRLDLINEILDGKKPVPDDEVVAALEAKVADGVTLTEADLDKLTEGVDENYLRKAGIT